MKIKINKSFFILFTFFIIYYDYTQLLLFISALIIHELSHIAVAKHYGLTTKSFNLTPLGIYCIIENIDTLPLFKKINITLAGVFANFLLFILFSIFNFNIYCAYFKNYNLFLLLFNILPIYPLDGSKLYLYIFSLSSFMGLDARWVFSTVFILALVFHLLPAVPSPAGCVRSGWVVVWFLISRFISSLSVPSWGWMCDGPSPLSLVLLKFFIYFQLFQVLLNTLPPCLLRSLDWSG